MWLLIVISVSVGAVALTIVTAVIITVQRMNYRQRYDFRIDLCTLSPLFFYYHTYGCHSCLYRLTSFQFSALQLHEDELCAAFASTPSSNQAVYQEESDDVGQMIKSYDLCIAFSYP